MGKEANLMIEVSKKISLRIKEREIEFSENGKKLTGNLEFNDDDEIS